MALFSTTSAVAPVYYWMHACVLISVVFLVKGEYEGEIGVASRGHFGNPCIPTPLHLLSGWRKQGKWFLEASCVRFLDWGGQREGDRGLVQMNNLYGIPGIVCQGDDGRPVSKPKQTDGENTHTPS